MDVQITSYMLGLDSSYPPRIGPNREVHIYGLNSGIGSVSATFHALEDQGGQSLFDYFFVTPKELGGLTSFLLPVIGERNMNKAVVIATTYGNEGGMNKGIKYEVLEERTDDNSHHFDNLEKLAEELRAREAEREDED